MGQLFGWCPPLLSRSIRVCGLLCSSICGAEDWARALCSVSPGRTFLSALHLFFQQSFSNTTLETERSTSFLNQSWNPHAVNLSLQASLSIHFVKCIHVNNTITKIHNISSIPPSPLSIFAANPLPPPSLGPGNYQIQFNL